MKLALAGVSGKKLYYTGWVRVSVIKRHNMTDVSETILIKTAWHTNTSEVYKLLYQDRYYT